MSDIIKLAQTFKNTFLSEHPTYKDEVEDLYELMVDEIHGGESAHNELSLFENACNNLLVQSED